jgi:2-phosphosulfolactate phosphatase
MPRPIEVCQLPPESGAERFRGWAAVAIDVLRASTTMVTALASGAIGIRTFLTVAEARENAAPAGALTGGERGGLPIEGFDLGNSPLEYVPSRVSGREIAFTTTNGTRAIASCSMADCVLVGCFVNAGSIVRTLRELRLPTVLVCAGTDGVPSLEDSLCAGLICERLTSAVPGERVPRVAQWWPGTSARAAREMWRAARRRIAAGESLHDIVARSQGGRNLIELERDDDIRVAVMIDHYDVVPRLDRERNLIVCGSMPGAAS